MSCSSSCCFNEGLLISTPIFCDVFRVSPLFFGDENLPACLIFFKIRHLPLFLVEVNRLFFSFFSDSDGPSCLLFLDSFRLLPFCPVLLRFFISDHFEASRFVFVVRRHFGLPLFR